MMNFIRKILFPFSILYGGIVWFRNFLFDCGVLKSYSFELPVIAVGNLSVGGTGKSPQIEYLIRLVSNSYTVATLSRGYKRQSEGFILADAHSNAVTLGDEPFQFYSKFPNIQVAVDANRKNGIEQLLQGAVQPDVILLDDAFQHRKVKAGFYILLTAYGDLYADDYMLPTGNLRESRNGAKRANVVVVTKCPPELNRAEQHAIARKLKLKENQQLYFSYIHYDELVFATHQQEDVALVKTMDKVLVAGIAKPQPFFEYLQKEGDVLMTFADHHHFSEKDIKAITEKARGNRIITTEKDYVRLKGRLPEEQLFYLPIKSAFISGSNNFDKTILNYVGKSTGNRSVY